MCPPRALLVLLVLLPLVACAAGQDGDDGYHMVTADITYGPHDKRDRQWRALMTALDRCHMDGFNDAQPAHPPRTRCLQSDAGGCVRFAAHLSWDCIGMGYQQN